MTAVWTPLDNMLYMCLRLGVNTKCTSEVFHIWQAEGVGAVHPGESSREELGAAFQDIKRPCRKAEGGTFYKGM